MGAIKLVRYYTPLGTWGELTARKRDDSEFTCYTMEKRWYANKRAASCIPEGEYSLKLRASPMVKRTSKGRYEKGWEVTAVPGRDFIMFHPGNYVRNSDGCILVGSSIACISHEGLMVTASQDTFDKFMKFLDDAEPWSIHIAQWEFEYVVPKTA